MEPRKTGTNRKHRQASKKERPRFKRIDRQLGLASDCGTMILPLPPPDSFYLQAAQGWLELQRRRGRSRKAEFGPAHEQNSAFRDRPLLGTATPSSGPTPPRPLLRRVRMPAMLVRSAEPPCPEGTSENSPMLRRWVTAIKRHFRPEGTFEVERTSGVPSGRIGSLLTAIPTLRHWAILKCPSGTESGRRAGSRCGPAPCPGTI